MKKKNILKKKQHEIDKSFGIASGKIIAGDHQEQARAEKMAADSLRAGAIACLILIVAMVGYSLFETTQDNFEWHTSIFRLACSVILSVPAAYLARESAKHRQQQYHLLQTSLDLSAIGPYLSSLPDNEQHKLKIKIANKLFGSKNSESQNAETFPINTQEILMKLLENLELKLEPKKDNEKDHAQKKK